MAQPQSVQQDEVTFRRRLAMGPGAQTVPVEPGTMGVSHPRPQASGADNEALIGFVISFS